MNRKYLIHELDELTSECREPDWDGNSALPISGDSLKLARTVAAALPEGMRDPTPSVDHDGNVFFQWGSIRRKYFALTFVAKESSSLVISKIGMAGSFMTARLKYDVDGLITYAKEHL